MKGVVKYINCSSGLCAIETSNNNFTIFEDFDEGLSIGDTVVGNLDSLGNESLFNETTKFYVEGFIEDFACSLDSFLRSFEF